MVYQRILKRFQDCVRRQEYIVTLHAEEQMREAKYRLRGQTPAGAEIELVALGGTGKMVIITVYAP